MSTDVFLLKDRRKGANKFNKMKMAINIFNHLKKFFSSMTSWITASNLYQLLYPSGQSAVFRVRRSWVQILCMTFLCKKLAAKL